MTRIFSHQTDHKSCLSKKKTRRIIVIGGMVAALYSGIWFIVSQIIYNHAEGELHQLNAQGQLVDCENLRQSGYPLRIGLSCDKLQWQTNSNGSTIKTGHVVASAPIYAPSWRSLAIAAPAQLEQAEFGSIEALWHELIIDVDFVTGSPRDLGMRVENLQLQLRGKDSDSVHNRASLNADFVHFRLNIEPFPKSDTLSRRPPFLRAMASFDALLLLLPTSNTIGQLPAISGEIDLRLDHMTEPPPQIDWYELLRDQTGRLEKLDLQFLSGGGVLVTGDFHISSTGKISAKLNLTLRQKISLLHGLRTFLPHQSGNFESLFFALNAMPKNEQGEPFITINIDEGRVRAGFIPLGTLPSF